MASMNCLVHQLLSFPLNSRKVWKRESNVKVITESNGYSKNLIDNIMRKEKNWLGINRSSTSRNEICETYLIYLLYNLTGNFENMCKALGIEVPYKTKQTTSIIN